MELSKLKNKNIDMTVGNPVRLLVQFSIPMLIGNLFQQVYNLVDSIVVGKLIGPNALAAVGATGSATFFFFAICNGIGSGGGIIVSQLFGAKEFARLKRCMTNVAYIMTVMPLIVGFIAYMLARPMLTFLDTPASVLNDSVSYMHVMCLGLLFVSLYNYVSSMLRALGDSVSPLFFLIFSCIVNGILDVVFVTHGFGVLGAAYATMISQILSAALCIAYAFKTNKYFKFAKSDLKFDSSIVKKVVKLGVPLSLQYSLIAISTMALQRVVNGFGEVAMATFTATSRIESIIHQPYQTLATAVSTFAGQNYGARKMKRIVRGYRDSLKIMAIFTVIMLTIMQLFSRVIMEIFVKADATDVIAMGTQALKITSLFYIFLGALYVIRGVSNGLGDGLFALINGVVEVFGRVLIPIALVGVSFIGVWGIWWSTGLVWFISGVTAWIRYVCYGGKKMHLKYSDLKNLRNTYDDNKAVSEE